MILTEEEAKKKLCPIYDCALAICIVIHGKALAEKHENAKLCGASGCMMWRWDVITVKGQDTGYCGLGGKP